MTLTRRQFIIRSAALLATIGIGGPLLLSEKGKSLFSSDYPAAVDAPAMVVVQLSGGNDGINTVIPYGMGAYYDARPSLRIDQKDVLPLDNQVGLHPSLSGLRDFYKDGKVAVLQGVGYPNPNRSHFRSMEIWQTAEPEKLSHSGWLGRYVQSSLSKDQNPLKVLQVGNYANKAFQSDNVNVPVIQTLNSFDLFSKRIPLQEKNRLAQAFLDMYDPQRQGTQVQVTCERGMDAYHSVEALQKLGSGYQNKVEYPKTKFASDLQLVSQMLAGKSGTKVYYVHLGGFDDHAQEKDQHTRVLKELDEGLTAFYQDLQVQGMQDKVVTMAFSEFGRRVKENGSGGTDHGTAGPVLIMGGKVKGGLYGVYPSLTNLDHGDLKYDVDFRSIYYTLIDGWLQGDAQSVLGKKYEKISFI